MKRGKWEKASGLYRPSDEEWGVLESFGVRTRQVQCPALLDPKDKETIKYPACIRVVPEPADVERLHRANEVVAKLYAANPDDRYRRYRSEPGVRGPGLTAQECEQTARQWVAGVRAGTDTISPDFGLIVGLLERLDAPP